MAPERRSSTNVVFLAGGPGLPVSYAAGPLRRSGVAVDWAFFEQPGCDGPPMPETVTAQSVLEAAVTFAAGHAAERPIHIVAHSWGAYLALALLNRMPEDAVARAVLLHPAPPTRAGLDESVAALFARVPPEVMAAAGPVLARTDAEAGRAIMRALLPAYCGRDTDLPDLDLAMHPLVYHGVMNTLGDYDQRAIVAANRHRLTLVFGETDHITPELYARHAGTLDGFDRATVRSGHFGFLEDPGLGALLRDRGL